MISFSSVSKLEWEDLDFDWFTAWTSMYLSRSKLASSSRGFLAVRILNGLKGQLSPCPALNPSSPNGSSWTCITDIAGASPCSGLGGKLGISMCHCCLSHPLLCPPSPYPVPYLLHPPLPHSIPSPSSVHPILPPVPSVRKALVFPLVLQFPALLQSALQGFCVSQRWQNMHPTSGAGKLDLPVNWLVDFRFHLSSDPHSAPN